MHSILIGFKNCGKTTVGQAVASQLANNFIDTDQLIEQAYLHEYQAALNCREIFQTQGELFFRQLEKKIITSLDPFANSIIATGAGSLIAEENRLQLKKLGRLIYLKSSFEALFQRLNLQKLPAYVDIKNPYESFKSYYLQRSSHYQRAADYEIVTDHKSIQQIAIELIEIHHGQ